MAFCFLETGGFRWDKVIMPLNAGSQAYSYRDGPNLVVIVGWQDDPYDADTVAPFVRQAHGRDGCGFRFDHVGDTRVGSGSRR